MLPARPARPIEYRRVSVQEVDGLGQVGGHLDLLFLRQHHHLLHLGGMNQLLEKFYSRYLFKINGR